MPRRPLLAVLAAASIGLAACGATDSTDTTAGAAPPASDPSPVATSEPDTEPTTPVVEDEGPGTDEVPTTPPVEDEGPGTDTPPAPAADPDSVAVEPVTLAFDGREVPVATSCLGADGAILATTEGEVTITLVREEGVALRYAAEGTTAETDEVVVEGGTDTTTYTATLSSDDVAPVEVAMVVMDDATFALEAC